MATINEAMAVNTEGFRRATAQDFPPPTNPEPSLIPVRNTILRAALPPLPGIFPSTDNIIDFHLGGKIPQFRTPLPAPTSAQGAGGSTTVVSSSSSGGGGGTTPSKPPTSQSASFSTPILNPDQSFTGIITLAKSFYLYSLSVNNPARVELYSTLAAQVADSSRDLLTAPGLGTEQGIISDVNIDTAPSIWYYINTSGSNGDAPQTSSIYISVTNNTDGSTYPVMVTIVYVPTQS